MREGSFANISCECDPTYTAGVLSEINTEIRRFAAKPMDADEHHRLQLSLASRLAGMCDTPMKVQAQLVSQHINGQKPTILRHVLGSPATDKPRADVAGRRAIFAD